MKDLKKTFTQHFLVSSSTSVAVLAFMALPSLEETRHHTATTLGASPSLLWIPATLLVIGFQYLSFKRSLTLVAHPLHRLMREAEHGEQGFAFKTRAKTKEEDGIKHAIEAANLRTREANEQAEELEAALEKIQKALSDEEQKAAAYQAKFEELDNATKGIRFEAETLKAAKTALELTLENERKSKIGAEVEKRAEEIYLQMERAVSAAATKSIWIPSLVHELKTPITLINELSAKLSRSWQERSLKEVGEEIETILIQSKAQLSLLDEILERQPPQAKPEPPALDLPSTTIPDPAGDQTSQPEPESILEITADVQLHELEPDSSPLPIGLSPQAKQNAEPGPSDYALESVLGALVDEFSKQHADVHYSIALDKDLEIELEDPAMLALLHTLAECASHCTQEGEVVFGVELQTEALAFDVVCNGHLSPHIDPILLARAERNAKQLGGQIEIESTTSTELHLSFNYPLGTPAPAAANKQVIELE